MHHKRPSRNRTLATLDKRSQALVLFNPHFFIFYQKEYNQASFGDRPSCETSQLFHINVGIFVMLMTSSSSTIFGPLKELSPYLLTRDPGSSASSLAICLVLKFGSEDPKTKHTIFACHLS
jgi:hypothetical protein